MDVIFAHPRAGYGSYTDYKRLVELSGFPIVYVDQVNFQQPNTVYVTTPLNGEWKPFRDKYRDVDKKAKIVWWSLERPGSEEGTDGMMDFIYGTKKLLDDYYFDEVWITDRYLWKHINDKRVRFVVLGSHLGLSGGKTIAQAFDHDVIHLSYLTGRRSNIVGHLKQEGIRIADNGWGEDRHDKLIHTRFMLNVHQDDWPVIEPLRFALAAAYAIPVISESMEDPFPYSRGGVNHHFTQIRYHSLVPLIKRMCHESYAPHRAMGLRMYDLMTTEYEFGRQVRKAAQAMDQGLADRLVLK
jgi:hypothetical protein